jgi:hypothetical protein
LGDKVDFLDRNGHKKTIRQDPAAIRLGLEYWMWRRMGGKEVTYVLVELALPNCLDTVLQTIAITDYGVRWPVVREYANLPTPFPPILFARHRMREIDVLYDGLHRLLAARHRGDKSITAYLRQNTPPPEGFSIVDKSSL